MSTEYEIFEDDEGVALVPDETPARTHTTPVKAEDVSAWLFVAGGYFQAEISIREGAEWARRDGTDDAHDTIELEASMIPRANQRDFAVLVDGKVFRVSVTEERKR